MSSSRVLLVSHDRLPATSAHRRQWIRQWIPQSIQSAGRLRRRWLVSDRPPGVRDTQVVIGGTTVWTGGSDPSRAPW